MQLFEYFFKLIKNDQEKGNFREQASDYNCLFD